MYIDVPKGQGSHYYQKTQMNVLVPIVILLSTTAFGLTFPSYAQEVEIGQIIILQEKKPVGVPLHREHPPNFWKHVPTRTEVTLEDFSDDGKWLIVRLASGEKAWVNLKYLGANASSPLFPEQIEPASPIPTVPPKPSPSEGDEISVWSSREGCEQVVTEGKRMAAATLSNLRLATWNLRWFPEGKPDNQSHDTADPTDLEWVACTIIWMQLDILAVQESLATPEARNAWDIVIRLLQERADAQWHWTPQPCGRPDDHHIGFLWNAGKVMLSRLDSLWQFNAKAHSSKNPCKGGLRPGHYAWVQSREKNGMNFHLIALHLKSGPTVFAVEERHWSLNRIDQAIAPLLKNDQDVVILGDFNTMGAGDQNSKKNELKSLRRQVAKEKPGFEDLRVTPQCTHYFRGRGGWLDHVLVSKDMKESTLASARVTGYCAIAGCKRIKGDYPLAYRQLSDHCPVVVEMSHRDEE